MLNTDQHIRRQMKIIMLALLSIGGSFAAWSTLVPLDGAIVAGGTVVIDGNVKKVQHQAGGIIGTLHVREGSRVKEGEILARLDETPTRANLGIVNNDLTSARTRQARLLAERDDLATMAPLISPELLARAKAQPEIDATITSEINLFNARRTSREGQRMQLRERIGQLRQEIDGTERQRIAAVEQLRIATDELANLEPLKADGLVQRSRLTALEREIARNDGLVGDTVARIAQAKGKISEIEVQISQLDRDRVSEATKELRETETKIAELLERRIAAEDQLKKIDIRSPATGTVHELAMHTVGGVVNPAEPLMLIVPDDGEVVVEARIAPQDIDQIRVDQPSRLRFTSFNQHTTPELLGTIIRRSATTTRDQQSGATFYTIAIRLRDGQLPKLNGSRLVPGMMAEAYVVTESRTAMSFLMKPLMDNWGRVFSGR
jgi:HlyD family secretion protein